MPIVPSKMPEVRDDLRDYVASGFIGHVIARHVLNDGQTEFPSPECHQPWAQAIEAYQRRLLSMVDTSELFHVSDEMTAMADVAGRTMPGYRLHRDDLPADSGLIVFDLPIGVAEHEAVANHENDHLGRRHAAQAEADGKKLPTVEVVAAMWRFAATHKGEPGVLVTTWTNNYDLARNWEAEGEPDIAEVMRGLGWLGYHDETVLPFGDIIDEMTDDAGNPRPIRNASLRTLISTWLLMGQPIVSSDPQPLSRQIRRGLERAGKPVPKVRVVKLRRAVEPHRETSDDIAGRTYKHQWVVRGHWRNQYYPSRNDHRPVYVPSHIKGPEGAPLLGGERVYDWSR